MRFVAGFAAVSVPMLAYVLLRSRAVPGLSLVATIVRDTFGHHTDPAGYGSSPFGLWGQATGITAFFGTPLVGQSPFTAPFFLLLRRVPGVGRLDGALGVAARTGAADCRGRHRRHRVEGPRDGDLPRVVLPVPAARTARHAGR